MAGYPDWPLEVEEAPVTTNWLMFGGGAVVGLIIGLTGSFAITRQRTS